MTYYLFQRGIHMNQFTQTYDFTQYFQCKNKQYQKLIQMIAVIIQSNHSHYPYSHTLILEILLYLKSGIEDMITIVLIGYNF